MDAALRGPLGRTELGATVLTIGSSPDNQLVVNDVKVSAHHAEIRPEGQRFSIIDLGSTHGTYVDSQRLDWNTAHQLTPGSIITIGDTTFTYEEGEAAPLASPFNGTRASEMSDSETPVGQSPPLVDAPTPGSFQTYPAYGVPQGNTQPAPGFAGTYPGYAAPFPGYAPPLPARPSRRRWLWISLIIVIVLGIAGGAAIVYFTHATPEKTIDAYCNALRGQDYSSAYNLLTSSLQKIETEAEFAGGQLAIGHTTICTHDSPNVTGDEATANLTLVSGGQNYTGLISLNQADSTWKISVLPSSPQLTLTIFCNALRAGDIHTAYSQYSQGLKSTNSEASFAQTFRGVTCVFSSINATGSTDTASIIFVNSSGPSNPYVIFLVQDPASNSAWKIDGIQAA
jgi:FHA domain-containing protein